VHNGELAKEEGCQVSLAKWI